MTRAPAGPSHAALIDGLCRVLGPGTERIETHISWLLLSGEHAYKLKKPLTLDFLDFGTLAQRRTACAEELRINRRTAPDIYLGVLPITGTPAAPRLGGDAAQAIDWAVHMRRFPAGALLAERAARGELQPAHIDALAREIAGFQAQAAVAPADSPYGDAGDLARLAQDNFKPLFDLEPPPVKRQQLEQLQQWMQAESAHLAPLMATRRAEGRVREGHGDLHLGNLLWLEGRARLFDAIEFNPRLRWIDVACDIAFLFMDLHAHGRPDLAWRFLDAYLAASGDYAGLAVLRPYEVYRALVRTLVARLRASQGGAAQGPDYLACAERLAAPLGARLLITYGLSGSGKSTAAAQLLQQGAVRLRSDVERKRLHGLAPLDDSAALGLDIYTSEASRRTFAQLAAQARALLAAGYPVIVDAAFLRRRERDAFHALARELGLPFAILHCHADPDRLRERVRQRRAAGGDPSEADLAVLARQQQQAEPLAPEEQERTLDLATDQAWDAPALYRRWLSVQA